jgi:hypothetical protein
MLQAKLVEVFVAAIEKVGLPAFKATSMFGSNDQGSLQKAA